MAQLAKNYFVNPFFNFCKSIMRAVELSGMARAARELERLGHYKEARKIYKDMRKGNI